MKTVTKRVKKEDYTASIKIFGKVYTAKGKDITEAISNLKPGNTKGVGILTLSKGKDAQTRILTPPQTFRLFTASRIMKEVTLKQVSSRFYLI